MSSTYTFDPESLRQFTIEVFLKLGIPENHAKIASDVLNLADLRGIDSHGVARLITYVELLNEGKINPKPKVKIIRERKSSCTLDGDNGLGLVVGPLSLDIIIERAREFGSGWASVCNTNHFGIAGYYSLKALEHDMLGLAMTNSTKLVAPLWGAERMLGTNPISIAFPGLKEKPVVIDLATSAAAYGKIELAKRKNESIPKGWIINKTGEQSTSPEAMIDGGALLPLGSDRETGGHKGYALAAMVDMLTAVLSGANWGPFAPPFALRQEVPERSVGKGIGHFFGVMEIDAFMDVNEFRQRVDEWVQVFRNTQPAKGFERVLIPGDPEHDAQQLREKNGIPVSAAVIDDLRKVEEITGVKLPLH